MTPKQLLSAAAACVLALHTAALLPAQPVQAAQETYVSYEAMDPSVNGGEPVRGCDISSILAIEKAGVVFHDDSGREADLFAVLADHGVNYIRVRVWNQPNDGNGHTYGGGDNDVAAAAEIGRRAAQYGMKLLVDFHYSDFWADPEKQTAPKAWQNYGLDEKKAAIYSYTLESLQTIRNAGADIGMVQVGNETNCVFCGENDMYRICELFSSGCAAVRDFDNSVLRVLHFADPSHAAEYAWYAQVLGEMQVDYDVFATSYYPYWHGTTDNLTQVLGSIAHTYDKYVMVAETAYPYTDNDGDTFGNVVSSTSSGVDLAYEISVEGQTQCLTQVFQAIADVGEKGIGVFYWEPAWLGCAGISWSEQKERWERYGSGWATDYATEYSSSASLGGSSFDNQALFDFDGHPLDSLDVFRRVTPQQYIPDASEAVTLADGIYTLKNAGSGLYLGTDAAGNILQSETPEQWTLRFDADGCVLTAQDGQHMSLGDMNDGRSGVRLGEADAQHFSLIAQPDGTYLLMTDGTHCLDIHDRSRYAGAWASYNRSLQTDSQRFVLTLIEEFPTEAPTQASTEPPMQPERPERGDIHEDGRVDLTDLVALQRHLVRVSALSSEQTQSADLNEDGTVNVIDLCLLKQMLLRKDGPFPQHAPRR
ncbi:MAG: glycosyl hydrolase 53 family protein [Oscillospiraceae bacterium]|nr:glycosyl hydrolase 53 family protein [Oscillospiraceae bacterium]